MRHVFAWNEAAMPLTSSAVPALAAFGIALLGIAGVLGAARHWRKS